MVNLNHVAVFRVVAEAGSFKRAAERLGMDRAQVSRTIQSLEATIGTPLIARTTRRMHLTREGQALLRSVGPALGEIEAALSAIPDEHESIEGEVVLTTTPDLGRTLLAAELVALRLRHPGLRLTVRMGHTIEDLGAARIDLALRVGRSAPSSLVARRLLEVEAGFFASAAYLERRGVPSVLEDLSQHDLLRPPLQRGRRAFALPRRRGSASPAALESEDFSFLAAICVAGGGVAILPTHVAEHTPPGALVRVLPKHRLRGAPLYLISRPPRQLSARARAVRDHLLASLRTRA